jgi:hypothetical protein
MSAKSHRINGPYVLVRAHKTKVRFTTVEREAVAN